MNRGMRKTTIREIKGSLGRYLAILAIVTLGVALFTGLKATTPAMIETENDYLAEQNFYDFRLLSTIGFEEADVRRLTEMEQTAAAEGAVSVDAVCTLGDGNESVYKFHTVPETINQIILTDGRLPEKSNECVLDSAYYGKDMIGAQITVTDNNEEDTLEMFGERTFTAVGIVRSPYYINFERGTTSIGEGKITAFLYVPGEAFACDYLTEIYVKTKQKYDVYTDAYEDYIDGMQEEMEGKTEMLALARYEKITGDAQKEIDDAQAEFDQEIADARKELEDARRKISDGEQEIIDGEQELRDGKQKAADGEREIASNEKKIADSERELADGEREIQEKEQEIRDAEQKIVQAEQEILTNEQKLADGRTQLTKAKLKIAKEQKTLNQQEAALPDQEAELKQQEEKLVKEEAQLQQQERQLAGQETELEQQETELTKKEAELKQQETELEQQEFDKETADAQKKIDDAREELAEIEEPDVYVLTRNTNIGYACYESDSNIVAGIANVFPVFFFLVAALICMTTMNRMVEEQRTQIGILKALGYGNGAIMCKYLFYAGSAAAAGAVLGCIIGTWLFPKVIWMGYSIMYSMGEITYYFDVWLAVFSMLAALLCSVGAAYASCRYELYSVPANLIRPKAPKSGKRIFLENIGFIWSRMKFLHKVSVRNIFRYKKRFFMMILGISGCTALLLTGFGVRDSVTNVADMQYDEIQVYDIGITFSEKVQTEDLDQLNAKTGDMFERSACRFEESVDLEFNGKTKSMYLGIAQNTKEMNHFLKLKTKDGKKIGEPAQDEAVLSVKIAETMGIRVGDNIVLRDSERNSLTVKVCALCENYIYNYAYISKETYEKQLGKEPDYKSAYVVVKEGMDIHEAAAAIADQGNVLSVSVTGDMRERIASMMKSMDYIVLLIIICAGSLAFIVLYNLTNINITERMREIATIKVLGFYDRETADYVFRENLALTGLGALAGLGLGKWLHWFVMNQVKIDMISFKTIITPQSYLWSLAFTFVFALLVDGMMYFKLEHIHMAEALKSME